jgi:hypothetical protein
MRRRHSGGGVGHMGLAYELNRDRFITAKAVQPTGRDSISRGGECCEICRFPALYQYSSGLVVLVA